MTRANFVGGLLLSAFFGATLWEAWSFQYGTEFAPGPGFAPVWLSAIGLCVSLLIAAHGLWAMRGGEGSDKRAAPALEKWGLGRVALSLLGLAAMVLLTEPLGLVASILLFLLYLTLVVQRHSVAVGIGASVGTVVFVYVVFVYFLEVPIPKGPLGF
ncbi:MAG: tripartite tricarboxylate transporter TctB family protein [Betaproteobacteria bacterium]|nr:tripartite tricarboxylate transporter TctB family protein [Betaproteobacteria bacterium]